MKYYVVIFLCFIYTKNFSQTFPKGTHSMSISFGSPRVLKYTKAFLSSGSGHFVERYSDIQTPIFLKYQYKINEKISIGLNLCSYKFNRSGFDHSIPNSHYNVNIRRNTIIFKVCSHTYRKKSDYYYGIGFGLGFENLEYINYPNQKKNGLNIVFPLAGELTFGYRNTISNKLSYFYEFGIASSFFQLGLMYKFKNNKLIAG